MLTFAKFIDLQTSQTTNTIRHSDGIQQPAPYELYGAYLEWFLKNSGQPISEGSEKKHPDINPESLFIHLLIQLKIIEEYSKNVNSHILSEEDTLIVEYKKAIQPIINDWLKNMDAAAYAHVLTAVNADSTKYKYIGLTICALIFATSLTLTVIASKDIIPPVFIMMIMPGLISIVMGCLVGLSHEPKKEVDTLHPALNEGFTYEQQIPYYEQIGPHQLFNATRRIYVAPHDAYFDGDKADFSLKHKAVVAYTKTEDSKTKIKNFVDSISATINTPEFHNRTAVEDLSSKVMKQRYSRKYTTFTTNVDDYEKQRINTYNGKPTLDLRS